MALPRAVEVIVPVQDVIGAVTQSDFLAARLGTGRADDRPAQVVVAASAEPDKSLKLIV
jgi:hypothetical protein